MRVIKKTRMIDPPFDSYRNSGFDLEYVDAISKSYDKIKLVNLLTPFNVQPLDLNIPKNGAAFDFEFQQCLLNQIPNGIFGPSSIEEHVLFFGHFSFNVQSIFFLPPIQPFQILQCRTEIADRRFVFHRQPRN